VQTPSGRPSSDRLHRRRLAWRALGSNIRVRNESLAGVVGFVLLHQIQEQADAGINDSMDPGLMLGGVLMPWIGAGKQACGQHPVTGRRRWRGGKIGKLIIHLSAAFSRLVIASI